MDTHYFREQLSIDTPEQVALAFPIAGLGSRILACMVDSLIQGAVYLVLVLLAALTLWHHVVSVMSKTSDRQATWITAAFIFVNFAIVWGYYALFEAFWNGQTPGKRLIKLRVIKDSGRQITLFESLARNFLRIVDMLPSLYIVGAISILATRENKRLGDLVAGTIVVRDMESATTFMTHNNRAITAPLMYTPEPVTMTTFEIEFPAESLAKLGNADLVLIESFFARIPDLDVPTTERLAEQILTTMCRKMEIAVPTSPSARKCLDSLAFSLRGSAVYR